MSSVQGFAVVPACTVYSASKAYIANLALAVQAELAGEGCTSVDTQLLCPNFVGTGMVNGVFIPLYMLCVASV